MKMKKRTNLIIAISVILIAGIVVPNALAQQKIDIPSEATLFKNVKVFNGMENRLLNVDVLVVRNKIHKVDRDIPASATYEVDIEGGGVKEMRAPIGGMYGYSITLIDEEGKTTKKQVEVNVINGHGMTLMPGLIDSHVHFNIGVGRNVRELDDAHWEEIGARAAYAAQEHFAMGFTTIRDMGGMHTGLKKTIDAGFLVGPRIYTAGGFISQTGGHGDFRAESQYNASEQNAVRLGIARLVDGRAEVLKAVRENYSLGAHFTKIMISGGVTSQKDPMYASQYTNDEIRAAIEVAESYGTYATAHVFLDKDVNRGLDLGLKCIDHGLYATEKTVLRMKQMGIFFSPNITALSPKMWDHPFYQDPSTPSYAKVKDVHKQSKHLFDHIRKVKPKLVYDSDFVLLSGVPFRQSMDYDKWWWAEQFGNFETLKVLTSTGGELCALTGPRNPYPGKLGVIEESALADIIIVDGNPLKDIRALGANPEWFKAKPRGQEVESIKLIMKDGKVYKNTLESGTRMSWSNPAKSPSEVKAELAKAARIYWARFEAGGLGCCAHMDSH